MRYGRFCGGYAGYWKERIHERETDTYRQRLGGLARGTLHPHHGRALGREFIAVTPIELRDLLQGGVLAVLLVKAAIDWIYGPSRITKIEQAVAAIATQASNRADELQKWTGRVEIKLAEFAKDHQRNEEQLRQLWHFVGDKKK